MAAPAILDRPAATPDSVSTIPEIVPSEVPDAEEAPAASIAYRLLHRIGRRFGLFGAKFRTRSIRAESNWRDRKRSNNIEDLKKMY